MNKKIIILAVAIILAASLFFSACEIGSSINDYSPTESWNPSFSFETESGMILSPESIDSENQVIQLNLNSGVTGFYVDVSGSDTYIAWGSESTSVSESGGRIYVTLAGSANQGNLYIAPYEGASTMYLIIITRYSSAPDGQSVTPGYSIAVNSYPEDGIYDFHLLILNELSQDYPVGDVDLGACTISGGSCMINASAVPGEFPSLTTGDSYTLYLYTDLNSSGILDARDKYTLWESIEYGGTNPWNITMDGAAWGVFIPADIALLDSLTLTGSDNENSGFIWDTPYREDQDTYNITTSGETGVHVQVVVKDPELQVTVQSDTDSYTLNEGNSWTSSRFDLNMDGTPTTITVTTSYYDSTSYQTLSEEYTLIITREIGTSAAVENVEVAGIEISDDNGDYIYQAGVPRGSNSAGFSITAEDSYALITFNSVIPRSERGYISGAYGLSEIDNPDTVTFTIDSEDGNASQTYTLEFYDQADSSLANLSLDAGTISFSPTNYNYSVTVPADTESVVITAAPTDASATVATIPASTFTGDQSSPIALAQGTTTDITVRCTNLGEAGDMDDSVTDYVISVYRPELWTELGGSTIYNGDIYRGELHEYDGTLYALGVHHGDWGIEDTSVWEYDSGSDSWNVLGSEQAVDGGFYTTMTIDPTNGTIYILSGMVVYTWTGASWSQLGSAVGSTGTGQTYSITVDPSNSDVYVAYADSTQGYKQTVKKWNGSAWDLVGTSGFSTESADRSEVFVFNSELYVLSGDADLRLYRWDGSSWVEDDYVNSSSINDVYTVNNGTTGVYLGYIEGGSSTYQPSVRYFDGSTGSQIGSSRFAPALSYHIALVYDSANSTLLAGYQTGDDGNDPVMIGYWDGSAWQDLAEVDSFDKMGNMNLVILDGSLYVGYGDSNNDRYMVKKYNGTLP